MLFSELPRAWRRLSTNPGFSLLAVTIFSVGIGLSVYVYTFMDVLFYKKLDFPGAERMTYMERKVDGQNWCCGTIDLHTFQYMDSNQTVFEDFGALRMFTWVNFTNEKNSARPWTAYTTPSMFDMLEVEPVIGRTLHPEDDVPGARRVVVIGYDIWQQVYDGRGDVIGEPALIQGIAHTVVGVMPEGFRFPVKHDMWIPLQADKAVEPSSDWSSRVVMFGKMKPGQTLQSTNAELANLMSQLEEEHPTFYGDFSVEAWPTAHLFVQNTFSLKFLLIATSIAIMFLVCFNISNVLVARANENVKEVAIRSALGAPRFVLMQQVLAESLILCAAGAGLGILLAGISLSATGVVMQSIFGSPSPFWYDFTLSGNSIVFVVFATIFAWLAAGLFPAWKASGVNCNEALKDANKGGGGKGSNRLTGALVTLQIFLSSVLVSVAVDSVLGLREQLNTEFGVDISEYITGHVLLTEVEYPTVESRLQYFDLLKEEVESEPGVIASSAANFLVGDSSYSQEYGIEDSDLTVEGRYPDTNVVAIQDNYFDTLGIEIASGRGFDTSDNQDAPAVGIVGTDFAEKLWPGQSPLGKRIQLNPKDNGEWITIVGVIPYLRQSPPQRFDRENGAVYRPFSQAMPLNDSVLKMIAKVEGDPTTYSEAVQEAARRTDARIAVDALWTLEKRINMTTTGNRLIASMFTIFGTISVLLAAFGIYSMSSRAAVLRIHEFGIRRALGSSDERIVSLLILRGLKHLAIGLSLGLIAALFLFTELLPNGAGQTDTRLIVVQTLIAFGGVSAIITFTVLLASLVPARRAVSLQPAEALHYE
jgi:predicted permease